jgi:hypothetical protein
MLLDMLELTAKVNCTIISVGSVVKICGGMCFRRSESSKLSYFFSLTNGQWNIAKFV